MITVTMSSFFSSKKYHRVFLWTLIILFVLSLPNAIILYRAANGIMSVSNVGRIPFIIFLFLFLITAVYIRLSNRNFSVKRFFPLLILSVIIWTAVPLFEENSNKYIHIPEYMVLSILVYVALSIDYSGSGILLLTFVLSSISGFVDEMQQGLYPDRYYGWKDMVINSSGVLLGVVMINAMTAPSARDWNWLQQVLQKKSINNFVSRNLRCSLYRIFALAN